MQKFAFPFSECAFEDKIEDDEEFEILSLVARLTEMHFYTGRDGWTKEMIENHRKLLIRLSIKVEEVQGLEMCTVSLHNLTHIHEDLLNFSASDNHWCAVYECAVKNYVKKPHNCKGIEISFARSETRREFLKSVNITQPSICGLRYNESKVCIKSISI